MTEQTIHNHTAEEFRVFVVKGQPEWAVLQISSQETGELFRFALLVEDLAGVADRLAKDARLLGGG